MNSDTLAAAAEEFQKQLGVQVDLTKPISVAEADALRDRFKSLMNNLTGQQEQLSELDQRTAVLSSRADDADETGRQLKALAVKVNELSARLLEVEDRLPKRKKGVPHATKRKP